MAEDRVAVGTTALGGLLFAAALCAFLFVTVWTLGQPAIDMWGFRPAQTIASVPYMLSEGAWLANIVPVFGEPWIFSQEFPIYQWLVAALVAATGIPVESAGRLISAGFAIACVWPIHLLATALDPANRTRTTLFVSALWLLAPPVLFWGRSTLIETAVIFFSLCWVAWYVRFIREGRPLQLVLCILVGALAASVKVTAFAGFVMAGFLFTLHFMARHWRELPRYAVRLAGALFCVVVPVAALFAWSTWTGADWKLNPLASLLSVSNIPHWYFGVLDDRFKPSLWTWAIGGRALPNIFGSHWALLAVATVVASVFVDRLRVVALLAASFLIGFLVFPRLFTDNIYYEVENLLFVVAMVGVVAAALSATRWWGLGCVLLIAAVSLQGWTLASGIYGRQFFDDLKLHPYYLAGTRVAEETTGDSVVVVFGTGWGVDVPQIAHRRGIVVANWFPATVIDDILFDNRAKWLGGRPVGAVVDCNVFSNQAIDPKFVPLRDRLKAEMAPAAEVLSGPVGNGSIDNPSCTVWFAPRS